MDYSNETYKVVKTNQGECIIREQELNEAQVDGFYSKPDFQVEGKPFVLKPRGEEPESYGSSRYTYPRETTEPSTTRYKQQSNANFQKPSVIPYNTSRGSTQVLQTNTYEPSPVRQYTSSRTHQRPTTEVLYHESRGKAHATSSWHQQKSSDMSDPSTAKTVTVQNGRPILANEGRLRPGEELTTTRVPARSGTEERNFRSVRSEASKVRQQYVQDIVANPNTNMEASQRSVDPPSKSIIKPYAVQNHYTQQNGFEKRVVKSSNLHQTTPGQDYFETDQNGELDRNTPGVQLDVHPLMYFIPLTCLATLLLAQTIVICHSENNRVCSQVEYVLPIVMTTITIILCFIIPLFWVLVMDKAHNIDSTADILSPYFSVILALNWLWVTPVITFNNPFEESGNGYFFAWGLFVISIIFARDVNEEFSNLMGKASHIIMGTRFDRKLARVLILASLFFSIAAIDSFVDDGVNDNRWEGLFVVILGPFLFLILLGYELIILCRGTHQGFTREGDEEVYMPEREMKILSIPLTVLWFIIAIIATFNDTSPFMRTGNGYYASWACAMGSLGLSMVVHGFLEEFGVY